MLSLGSNFDWFLHVIAPATSNKGSKTPEEPEEPEQMAPDLWHRRKRTDVGLGIWMSSECGGGKVHRGETTGPCCHQEEAFALIFLFFCLLMDLQTL